MCLMVNTIGNVIPLFFIYPKQTLQEKFYIKRCYIWIIWRCKDGKVQTPFLYFFVVSLSLRHCSVLLFIFFLLNLLLILFIYTSVHQYIHCPYQICDRAICPSVFLKYFTWGNLDLCKWNVAIKTLSVWKIQGKSAWNIEVTPIPRSLIFCKR